MTTTVRPDLARAALDGWPGTRLTPLERDLVRAARAGEPLSRPAGRVDVAAMRSWGADRTIRASVLHHLLTAPGRDERVHERGIRLHGVRISGRLDLSLCTLHFPLRLEKCYLSGRQAVNLEGATVPDLTLTGCYLPGLTADSLEVTRDLTLSGSTFGGPARLIGARVGGDLTCRGARLTAGGRYGALVCDRLKVGGQMLLDRGFSAAGAVRLLSADIASDLSLDGARLDGASRSGCALWADRVKVGGNLFLGRKLTAAAALSLSEAAVTGNLYGTGMRLTSADVNGIALYADQLTVGGDVFLDGMVTMAGAVQLSRADIAGSLFLGGARLTGSGDGGALFADGLKVGGTAHLSDGFAAAGTVSLGGAALGGLNCTRAKLAASAGQDDALAAELMTVGGNVLLQGGFTATGTVRLTHATITGSLQCGGATLTAPGDGRGVALHAVQLKVGGGVLLGSKLTVTGGVWLLGADIAGVLSCAGAVLTMPDPASDVLTADGIKVGGSVFLNEGFTATGVVRLLRADITGQLNCWGATLKGADGEGYALLADGMRVGADVFLSHGFSAAGAVRLLTAEISRSLECDGTFGGRNVQGVALYAEGMAIGGNLTLDDNVRAAAGAVRLSRVAVAGSVIFSGELTGPDASGNVLYADGIRVSGNLFLGGKLSTAGAVRLVGADITGQLSVSGDLKPAAGHGIALAADGLTAGGSIQVTSTFKAAGTVRLLGVHITGQLNVSGAHLAEGGEDGVAVLADGVTVTGDVRFADQFTAAGSVRLPGADITGQLCCSGFEVTKADREGFAFAADGAAVGGDVMFTGSFTVIGGVQLLNVRVGGSLICSGARLVAADGTGYSLTADGLTTGQDVLLDQEFTAGSVSLSSARIGQTLRWRPASHPAGTVNLEDATAGQLEDDWSGDRGRANAFWPSGGQLRLDGFTYSRIGGEHPADAGQRLGWLRSQYAGGPAPFTTQPYEQLADFYQQTGQDAEAVAVAIARRRDLRRNGHLPRARWLGNLVLDFTIRYGYQTWRAVFALAAVFAAAVIVFSAAQRHGDLIVPVATTPPGHAVPTAMHCVSPYPCFYPVGYSIDTVIPIINVHQADYWGPNGDAPGGPVLVVFTWVWTILGWALATLVVAGYTGLVRSIDA